MCLEQILCTNYKSKMKLLDTIIKENFQLGKKNGITFLTGAGISAASGIPTYRSTGGIWVKGTKFFKPQEFGTFKYFSKHQEEVWQFTLFRKGMIEAAKPNTSHTLLRKIEQLIPSQFSIITQNIDGLHQRGGSSPENVFEIHGNMRKVRCVLECSRQLYDFPKNVSRKSIDEDLLDEDWKHLQCPKCEAILRPNILWFDEFYNEHYYHRDTALDIARNSGILIVIGTSGATTLPIRIIEETLYSGGFVIEVNPEENNITTLLKNHNKTITYSIKSDDFLLEFYRVLQNNI